MPHFIYDNTGLPFPKTDVAPLPPGANVAQYVVGTDWNNLNQAVIDVRDSIREARYFGFEPQASDPAPTAYTTTWLWVRASDGQIIHRRPDGTSRELLDKNSHLLPDGNNTRNIGSSGSRWANLFVTQLSIDVINSGAGTASINLATPGQMIVLGRDLLPQTGQTQDLGSSSDKWAEAYITTAFLNVLNIGQGTDNNVAEFGAGQTAALAAASKGRIRYNASTNKFQSSVNNGAYQDFVTGSGGYSLVQADGSAVAARQTINFSSAFTVVDNGGNTRTDVGFAGSLPNLTLTGTGLIVDGAGTDRYIEMGDGDSAAVSSSGKGRIRYNNTSDKFEISMNGGAYVEVTTGAAGVQLSESPTWTGLHTWNNGTTPSDVATIGVTPLASDGVRDSHYLHFTGSSRSSSVNHVAHWRQFVNMVTGSGTSALVLQTRIDAAAYAEVFRLTDGGFLTINTLQTSGRVGAQNTSPAVALHVGDATNPGQMLLESGSGNTAYAEWEGGQSAAVSAAGAGRVRFNASTNKFQMSENGAAYADVFHYSIKVSANDTTPAGLLAKLTAGSAVTIVELNDGGNETVQISAAASNFGTTGNKVTEVLRVGDSESHNDDVPKIVCQFSLNPQDYVLTNTTRSIVFRAVASNGDTGITTHVELYNLTDGESISILDFTSTTPTMVSETLTIGAGAGEIDDSQKIYEVRIYVDSPDGVNDTIELGSAEIQVTNTID